MMARGVESLRDEHCVAPAMLLLLLRAESEKFETGRAVVGRCRPSDRVTDVTQQNDAE